MHTRLIHYGLFPQVNKSRIPSIQQEQSLRIHLSMAAIFSGNHGHWPVQKKKVMKGYFERGVQKHGAPAYKQTPFASRKKKFKIAKHTIIEVWQRT